MYIATRGSRIREPYLLHKTKSVIDLSVEIIDTYSIQNVKSEITVTLITMVQ